MKLILFSSWFYAVVGRAIAFHAHMQGGKDKDVYREKLQRIFQSPMWFGAVTFQKTDLGAALCKRRLPRESHGFKKDLVKIDRWEPTTKMCRFCGCVQDLPLNRRVLVCGGCGNVECRDLNASCNILEAGRRLRSLDTPDTLEEASVVTTAKSHRL